MTDGGWAATATAALVGAFGLVRHFARKRKAPEESDQEWRKGIELEMRAARQEIGEMRVQRQREYEVQMALLTRIDVTLATSDLPSMTRTLMLHDARLTKVERRMEAEEER